MHLHAVDYVLWFSAIVIQIGILLTMYARKLYRAYPFFTLYLLVQMLSEPILLALQRHSYIYYYWGYWISVAFSALISAAILYEVAQAPFRRGATLSKRTAFWFVPLLLLSVGIIFCAHAVISKSVDEVTSTILLAQRSVRVLQIGFMLLLMISWRSLHIPRRDPLLGIMLGFGVFATVTMMIAAAASHGTFTHMSVLRQINSAAYCVACVIWLAYMLRAPGQTRWAEFRIAV